MVVSSSLPSGLTVGDRVEVRYDGHVAVGTVTRVLSREGERGGLVEVSRDGSFTGFETGDHVFLHDPDCERCS